MSGELISKNSTFVIIESGEYPVSFYQLRQKFPRISFPEQIPASLLAALGVAPVQPVELPAGDVVTEAAPELIDGQWFKRYNVRPFNADELAEKLEQARTRSISDLMRLRDNVLAKGFPYTVNGQLIHIQLRPEDRTNLLILRTLAKEAIADGTEITLKFRPYENISVSVTPQQMADLTDTALAEGEKAYQLGWELLDQINNAMSQDELPVLPATLFETTGQ